MNYLFILILFVLIFMFLESKNILTKSVSILLLFLFVFYTIQYNKDTFILKNNNCDFIPLGKTLLSCKDRCMSEDRSNYNINCNSSNCEELCYNCNTEDCKWKTPIGIPDKAKIRGISGNGNAKITWISPYNHNNKITAYSLFIINKQNPEIIRKDFPPNINCKTCEYIINNIKNGVEYEVFLFSKNKVGYSEKSNIINIFPTINNTIKSYMNIDQEPEESQFLRLSDKAQKKFINDFEDKNLINKIKYLKGKIFQADKINLNLF